MAVAAALVLVALQHQPPCWADRKVEPATKAAQLETIAAAISRASPTPELASFLLTIGYAESRWCLAVGSGARRGGAGEGYWQLEGPHHGAGARSGLSLEATTSAAALASAQLQRSYQCGSSPDAVLTAYAGRPCGQVAPWYRCVGADCVRLEGWPTLDARVRGYWWALSALRRAGAA